VTVCVEDYCQARLREAERQDWVDFATQHHAVSQLLRPFVFAVWPETPRPRCILDFMLPPMHFGDIYGAEAAHDKHVREMRRGIAPGDLGL
jgi:hypothetical protein